MKLACGACLVIMLLALPSYGVILPIEEVKQIDINGDSELEGEVVTVTGVVTAGSETFSNETKDLDAYIQDKTGGINIYTRFLQGISLKLGDSVIVTGTVNMGFSSPIGGITRLKIESLSDIEIVGRGTLPVPVVLTASELTQQALPPFEPYEGVLVRIEDVSIVTGEWPTDPGLDRELTAQDAMASFTFRIDGDTDIGGTDRPPEPFIIIGVVVQNDRMYPLLSDYTIWPRSRYEDFLNMGNGSGAAVLEPSVVDNDVEAFDLAVTLTGNSRDTITAFSVDLPLIDGWTWPGGTGNVDLSGPGVSQATYEVTATGVIVRSSAIWDADLSVGTVTLKSVAPPAGLVSSYVTVKTSTDGITFADVSPQPVLKALYPKPDVYITEIYPHDGTTSASNAFVELRNNGSSTAFLEGFALCEVRPVPYCAIEVRHIFGPGDTLPAGAYLVLAESATGFSQRFDYVGAIPAAISPLGRVRGDGGVCGGDETYEVISLWRDASLSDLVDHIEYKDAVACPADMCEGFDVGGAFPYIPPKGYALLGDISQIPEYPYRGVLSSTPTPGEDNVIGYKTPVVQKVVSHVTDVVEVIFSEPMGEGLTDPANFEVCEPALTCLPAVSAHPSLSREKVLLLFDDLAPGTKQLLVTNVASLFGQDLRDTLVTFTLSSEAAVRACTIQDYDAYGFSPVRDSTLVMVGFITVPPGVFQPDYSSIYVQGLDGCGVNVFSYDVPSPAPAMGDFVSVQGDVTEYVSSSAGSTTEIYMSSPGNLAILSRAYPEPAAVVLRTGDVSREENEGRLLQTEGAIVSTSDYDFYIDDGSGGIQIYQNYTQIDFSQFRVGMYARVKGVVLQYDYTRPFLESYELVPRYESDIEIIEGAFPTQVLLEVDARVFCPSCGEESFTIRFGGESLSEVVLRLFDVGGREIQTLYSGPSLGTREIQWSGKDSGGNAVPPGLYVCFLEVTEPVSGKKTTASVPIVVGIELK